MARGIALVALVPAILLASACKPQPAAEPVAQATEVPEELQQSSTPPVITDTSDSKATPMAERVATIGLLNKRNNQSQDLELKPGQQQRIGDIIVRVQACDKTMPWELERDSGAFVQVMTAESPGSDRFTTIFSGWLFKNKPAINVVEHPIYDVWVKDCKMDFPGDEASPAA